MANLMAVLEQPKAMTLSDRVSNAASDIANINGIIGGMLSRAYGPEPMAGEGSGGVAPGKPPLSQNVEFLESNIKRLYEFVERLHGIA